MNQKGFCFIGIGLVRLELIQVLPGLLWWMSFALNFLMIDQPSLTSSAGQAKTIVSKLSFGVKSGSTAAHLCHTKNLRQQFEKDIGETHGSGRKSGVNCLS
jgi:hypothetical protein